ncbi:N-acetylmuramoyl-L-alanine amidase [Clostridium sp. CF012]|uniref:N-acetylmuramoyl-L-alanine amidase n=1 Tax=Clostridium sp. CF012 TaxID=2843319 RepID=UPI001C0C89BD|nr:N-acetylmuramoyl-L-alanine amidase [Clostridium sp. CF012]MBU3144949.1 N-acetylmuramoyl-L-alanine amidase [Clostridium sp. CF012]
MNILNIGVNDGHTIRGFGTGAVGIIKEGEHTRLVGAEVRRLIKEYGHNAINCTIDSANSVNQSLSLIMDQANRQDLDWFISIHFNAGGGQGVEAYTYAGRQYQDAIDVCKNISSLGFKNRGVKDGKGLYVIKRTIAKSMLIEVCFVDTADANHYLKIGYKAIAKAIVEAIIGPLPVKPIVSPKIVATPTQGTVIADILNVRSGPGTGYKIIGELAKGDKVKIAKKVGTWYSIYFGDHGGYVSAEFIK